MHSWLFRHRLRLAAIYGLRAEPEFAGGTPFRLERPRRGVAVLHPAQRRRRAPAAKPRRAA